MEGTLYNSYTATSVPDKWRSLHNWKLSIAFSDNKDFFVMNKIKSNILHQEILEQIHAVTVIIELQINPLIKNFTFGITQYNAQPTGYQTSTYIKLVDLACHIVSFNNLEIKILPITVTAEK